MNRLTSNLMLSALLAAPSWAQADTSPQKAPDFDKANRARATGVQDQGTPPLGPPTKVISWSAEQIRDQANKGADYTEPPIIIDDWRGKGALDAHWARLEGELQFAAAELVRATQAGVEDSLEPFRKAVEVHAAQLRGGHIYPFDDLQDYQPPVLEVEFARDLHARTIDVAIRRRLRAMTVDGQTSGVQFDALRKLLSQRAQALGDTGRDLSRLRALLTEGQGAQGPQRAASMGAFRLELERQRMVQARKVAVGNLDPQGCVQLGSQLRMAKLVERVKQMKFHFRDQIVYPVR